MIDTDANQQQTSESAPVHVPTVHGPNDQGSVSVSGVVRIFDPNTNETLVETRA